MGKAGFTEADGQALNDVVRGVIERAIATLQGIGLTHEGALDCLITQSVIRMADSPMAARLQAALDDGRYD